MAAAIGPLPGVARIVATPNGYLNLYLERPSLSGRGVRDDDRPGAG